MKKKIKKHKHQWEEDEMFSSGAVSMICGSPKDLGRETRMICKCGAVDYKRVENLGSIVDLVK